MTAATLSYDQVSLTELLAEFVGKRPTIRLFGMIPGYRAYLAYTFLNAKSDEELAELGLDRSDIGRVAMSAVLDDRRN